MKVPRRTLLAGGAASAVSMAMQTANVPADIQDAKAPPTRNLLSGRLTPDKIRGALLPRAQWKPYPTAYDRPAWEGVAPQLRAALVAEGERQVGGEWPIPKATRFLEYVRIGNRSQYERELAARRNRLCDLVIAECIEGKGRFLDEIANGVWSTCEETFWGYPAHLSLQKRGSGLPDVTEPTIDLFAAEGGALLAWTHYLLGPQLARVHPMVPERIEFEVSRRIIAPYLSRNDFWWLGLESNRPMNNWNPWINSNCLAVGLLMERDEARRAALAHKVVRSVDRFLDSYHDDGGCDEGPSYWGHAGGSLFDNLELLRSASNGALDFYRLPLIQEIGRYIYRVHIAGDWYVNFADASARVAINGDLAYRYGKRIGDPAMQALGARAAQRDSVRGGALLRFLPALFTRPEIEKAEAKDPLVKDAWLPGIQVMTARVKDGSAEGLYVAAQGGHNAESHNHNDVGNFIVYADGQPVLIDVGVETYSAKTFSSRRYEIWTMQSAYHNTPTVNGMMQGAGRKFAARDVKQSTEDGASEFALDIAGAYPREAGIQSWRRAIRLDRLKNQVTVRDSYVLQKNAARIDLSLMTPCEAKVSAPGELTLTGGKLMGKSVKIAFPEHMKVAVEAIPTEDARLKPVWGSQIYRILLTAENAAAQGELTVTVRQG